MLNADVNECVHDNGGCTQECHNTDGSHYCTCGEGYVLSTDQQSCSGSLILVTIHVISSQLCYWCD